MILMRKVAKHQRLAKRPRIVRKTKNKNQKKLKIQMIKRIKS